MPQGFASGGGTGFGPGFLPNGMRISAGAADPNIINGLNGFTESNNAINGLAGMAGTDIIQQSSGLMDQMRALGDVEQQVGKRGAMRAAGESAARGVDVDAGTFERQTRGQDLSDRQKAAASKRIGLTRSIARADASGATERRFEDDAKNVRRVAGSFSDALFSQRLGVQADQANLEGAKKAADAQRSANKKAGKASTIGTVIGIGLAMFSSESMKDKRGEASGLLDKLKNVRVENWNYKKATRNHIGPYAEEFNDTFEVNQDNRGMINVIDALGVTLGAVKELDRKIEARG